MLPTHAFKCSPPFRTGRTITNGRFEECRLSSVTSSFPVGPCEKNAQFGGVRRSSSQGSTISRPLQPRYRTRDELWWKSPPSLIVPAPAATIGGDIVSFFREGSLSAVSAAET